MLIWSKKFETNIDIVDTEHKNLFDLVNKLTNSINQRDVSHDEIERAIKLLYHYTKTHFHDEELIMIEHRVDNRHTSKHCMEHKSFIYDLDRINDITDSVDRRLTGKAIKLVRFITYWLTCHVLGTDNIMAAQIINIKSGMMPQQAFETAKDHKFDATTVHMMMDAVYNLWLDAKDRCNLLEKKIYELGEKDFQL